MTKSGWVTEGRGSAVKRREAAFEGGEVCKNPIGLSMYDGPMETVEYIWTILDY